LGTGATNTAAIVVSCGEANIAARICDNLVLNGYSDWFLPSIDELNLIYLNLYKQNLGGVSGDFWSSTQVDPDRANCYYFNYDYLSSRTKYMEMNVRAVRAF
jgi:hypothetical protein